METSISKYRKSDFAEAKPRRSATIHLSFGVFSASPYYHAENSCFLAQIRSGSFCQDGHRGLAGDQNGGNGESARGGEPIAMGMRQFFDQAMGPQHPQFSPRSGGAAASFLRRIADGIIKIRLEIAVAKAVQIEFCVTNGFQQNPICAPHP